MFATDGDDVDISWAGGYALHLDVHCQSSKSSMSSSREVRIRVPFFVVYFSRGTIPQKG